MKASSARSTGMRLTAARRSMPTACRRPVTGIPPPPKFEALLGSVPKKASKFGIGDEGLHPHGGHDLEALLAVDVPAHAHPAVEHRLQLGVGKDGPHLAA